ncbi:hypothetical protein [Desulfosporosinus shakirovi]|uniref:hypothetical protein n=1 Tax=Desulfosporosinus shakirovi TaxID=2885154 RepID=UPI001E551696|nr:hypothetical protein [Desulfosporosinus sp. SRJS8]MCB8814106.1 hypothetical protein [Desulfosporosinus sp. SRJS8]
MADYYSYLWSTTWPSLIVLFLIFAMVLSRLVWKSVNTWRNARDVWGFLLLALKVSIWIGVLGVYTELFLFSQPDWFDKPGIIEGSVQGKAFDSGLSSYSVDIRSGTQQMQFYVDYFVYEKVKVDDQVELMYLPTRREVIRCEVLGSLL